jgi:hypothetical protein
MGRESMAHRSSGKDSPFYVPPILDVLGGLVHRHRQFWLGLGRLETKLLAHDLAAVPVTMPIYVCGLARSGSTLLHEIVAAHPRVATHRVKDYPLIFIPYWWRRATARRAASAPHERPHQDRILITTDSPDALEEMLWQAFFPRCHDPSVNNQLGTDDRKPAFEAYYSAHIRKLLLAERATRYVAKANYHIARLRYLLRLFPDARFLLPVRSPAGHIASLRRQHRWFSAGQRGHRGALAYMQRSGHFEFGLDRRPINLGDGVRVQQILSAWAAGEEVRGWARYWDMIYSYLARLLESDAKVRAATKVVWFEALCDDPARQLRAVLEHCRLADVEPIIARFAPAISRPEYYDTSFTPEELAVIEEETATTARAWGFPAAVADCKSHAEKDPPVLLDFTRQSTKMR